MPKWLRGKGKGRQRLIFIQGERGASSTSWKKKRTKFRKVPGQIKKKKKKV